MKRSRHYTTIGTVYDYFVERHRQTGETLPFPTALEELRRKGQLASAPPPMPPFRLNMDVDAFFDYLRGLCVYADSILPHAATYLADLTIQESELFWKGQDVFTFLHMPYQLDAMHRHDFFEISYVFSGSCTFLFEGESVSLSAGDICIVTPMAQHSLSLGPECLSLAVAVRRDVMDSLFSQLLTRQDLLSRFFYNSLYGSRHANYILIKTGNDPLVFATAQQLTYETNLIEDCIPCCCVGLMNLFLARALRAAQNSVALYRYEEHSKQDFDFILVLQYIQQNYRTVSLAELGKTFHFDEKYLSKLIQKNMGQNFIDVLRTVKMNHAVDYLTNTSMGVSSIAEAVGYDSADYFSRAFRRVYGMSPQQYRKNQTVPPSSDECL